MHSSVQSAIPLQDLLEPIPSEPERRASRPLSGEPFELRGVARTLTIPLWARAVETKKPRPIMRDPHARELMDAIAAHAGFDFSIYRHAWGTQLGCVVRGLLFDAWTRDFVRAHPRGTVVELGAGLTTRFERLDRDLGAQVHWVDIDLPEVIAIRRRLLGEAPASSTSKVAERRASIGISVTDTTAWIAALVRRAPAPYFFVSEGMLMYLQENEVKALFTRMSEAFPGSTLAFDSISPLVVKNQSHHDSMKHLMDAPFGWGIRDVHEIERWMTELPASPHDAARARRGITIHEVLTLADIAARFPRDVPRRHRMLARLCHHVLPWLTRSYRLTRASFSTLSTTQ